MLEINLIKLYSFLEDCYNTELKYECQRFSPNQKPLFTDVEVLTCYFWAILEDQKFKVKGIYSHIKKYWCSWFPNLPSYQAFNYRLNRLSSIFPHFFSFITKQFSTHELDNTNYLIDSVPIIMCKHKNGKVAPELANKVYSGSKKMYYYGIKFHYLGQRQDGGMPIPIYGAFTPASVHDSTPFKQILSEFHNCSIFGDKAYFGEELDETLAKQNCLILRPEKKIKNEGIEYTQFSQAHRNIWGRAVSSVRQPIESFFNWIIEKTEVQNASKVRSTKGLLVHAYGKIIAAFMILLGF